jgi:hypothetical protein
MKIRQAYFLTVAPPAFQFCNRLCQYLSPTPLAGFSEIWIAPVLQRDPLRGLQDMAVPFGYIRRRENGCPADFQTGIWQCPLLTRAVRACEDRLPYVHKNYQQSVQAGQTDGTRA